MNMRNLALFSLTAVTALLTSQAVFGADGKSVFSSNCASCHDSKGQGTPGLAPALKGDAFVTGGKLEDVLAVVTNGRAGDQKKFKDMPIAMPAWSGKLSDADIKTVVDYIRGDLQK